MTKLIHPSGDTIEQPDENAYHYLQKEGFKLAPGEKAPPEPFVGQTMPAIDVELIRPDGDHVWMQVANADYYLAKGFKLAKAHGKP